MKFNEEFLYQHPDWKAALQILEVLQKAGHEAVLAGGCVRDGFLGRIPKDIDIATSAEPTAVEVLFKKTVLVGKAFGVVRVLDFGGDIEVASFRFDGEYQDGRRPETVRWATAAEDALRRDFTINALFYDPVTKKVQDFIGGLDDIKSQTIQCVGQAPLRFAEDHLRLLRAVRFAIELNFKIAEPTWQAVLAQGASIASVSRERIRDEVFKILKSSKSVDGFLLLHQSGLLKWIDPDFEQVFIASQNAARKKAKAPDDANEVTLWTYYFSWSDAKSLKKQIESYKLSRELSRSIGQALAYFQQSESMANWTNGKKLALTGEPEFQRALDLIGAQGQQEWIEELKSELARRHWQMGVLPHPLLSGQDIPNVVPAAERGQWLQKAYEIQLEFQVADRNILLQKMQESK